MSYDYEALSLETIPLYLKQRPQLANRIDISDIVSVDEIGDGNLNYVFRATDGAGNSIILKQALPYVRMTGEGWPMTPERAKIEARSLLLHSKMAPGSVVQVLDEDWERYVFAMEDLSNFEVWRGVLCSGEEVGIAPQLGTYVGKVLVSTAPNSVSREELEEFRFGFSNPALCEITEDLVFTEPIFDIGRNEVLVENQIDADQFANDKSVLALNSEAKWIFMTSGEAVIHGDLHTGSVMVNRKGEAKVFDSEFAFYGPISFDLGALLANYCIASTRAFALGDIDRGERILHYCEETLAAFESTVRKEWIPGEKHPLWGSQFVESRIEEWRRRAWIFAACKMSRRVVGAAKTKDLTSLEKNLRIKADRAVLLAARKIAELRENEMLENTPGATQLEIETILRATAN